MSIGPTPVVAGVELGGTKTIAVVGRGRTILDRLVVPTTTPAATLDAVAAQLREWEERYRLQALGVASFGPVAIRPGRADYGRMLATPKPGWQGVDVIGPLAAATAGRVALHTDVTAAALAEQRWGAAAGLSDLAYVTVGTGIGVGIIAGGVPVAGLLHPEAGHIRVRRIGGDAFAGTCPFHGDCLEGLAAGPAIAARAGVAAADLAADDPAWIPVADALAEGIAMLLLTLSAEMVVVGGGVGLGRPHLLGMVRARIAGKLAGYLPDLDEGAIARMIVPAALGADAGPLGALALASRLAEGAEQGLESAG